jgi:ATP-binding cassette subfamily B protein
MKEKLRLFRRSIRLVWDSAPGWTASNISVSVIQSLLPLLLVYLIKDLIDAITKAVSAGQPSLYGETFWMIIAVVSIYLLDEVSSDTGAYVRKKQSVRLEGYMYRLLHAKAVKLDLINFEHPQYFDCLSRAASEAPWRPNSILNNVVSMFRGLLSLLLMAGLLLTLHWSIALILVAVNIPGIWLRLHFADILYNFRREETPEARKSAYFNWLLTGDRPSRELRLFGIGKYFMTLFDRSFNRQKENELVILRRRTLIGFASDLVKASAILFILLFITRRTLNGILSLGQMAMFLLAFRQGMTYIKDLFGSLAALYEDGLFIGDTFEFLNLRETMAPVSGQAVATETLKKRVSLNEVSFTYPGNSEPSIRNVSFDINKGEVVALVGPNGAGKSTLVKLLTRLYDPDAGSVTYDDNNIRNMDPENYRKNFSVIFQDFMLYNLSAGENIRMGDINMPDPDPRIESSAKAAGIDEMIRSLPSGYETMIGTLFNESRDLSWGEWQKIALARAIFRESSILILDEPSSSLDSATEYEIFSRFREIVNGRTSLLITHRLSNVMLADRIIVLDRGQIMETGTHSELMEKKGMYHNMFTKQFERVRS